MATRSSTKTSDIYTSTVPTSTIYTVSTDQVVQVAEDVDAEQRGAHRQDVEVELVVGQHAHVPAIYRTLDDSDTHIKTKALAAMKYFQHLFFSGYQV